MLHIKKQLKKGFKMNNKELIKRFEENNTIFKIYYNDDNNKFMLYANGRHMGSYSTIEECEHEAYFIESVNMPLIRL